MILGFTGAKSRMTPAQVATVRRLFAELKLHVLHHGDCIGSDEQAHQEAKDLDAWVVIHPPENDTFRAFCKGDEIRPPAPYLKRNLDIAKARDGLIATPRTATEVLRSGTWATVRYARALNRPLWIVLPDGSVA
jgi:hypothetical protein